MKKIFFVLLLLCASELSAAAARELVLDPDFEKVAKTYIGSKIIFGFKKSELQSMIETKRLEGNPGQKATLDALSDVIRLSPERRKIIDKTGHIDRQFRLRGETRFKLTGKGYNFFGLRVRAGQFRALGQVVPAEFATEMAEG